MPGKLFVVATPLGNLDDLTARAAATLRAVRRIACEDTRRTSKLLRRFEIEVSLMSCHKFNERERLEPVLAILRDGGDVALVSDGGTPGISDPGAHLVAAALAAGATVVPIPGPSAVVTLLSVSGLSADRFVFEGFLPHRAGERRRRLRELRSETRTLVVYEAPHRIRESLDDLATIFGDRTIVLGRELTKLHETILRGTPLEVLAALGPGDVPGEIAVAIAGAPEGEAASAEDDPESARLRATWRRALEDAGGDRRDALRRTARELGWKRAETHRRLAEIGEDARR